MTELRCGHTMHGVLEDGVLEVKCRNSRCGARSGIVVLHKFDIITGNLLSTQRFKDPSKEVTTRDDTIILRPAVRSA
jgi:hypothetical protein